MELKTNYKEIYDSLHGIIKKSNSTTYHGYR